MSLNSAIEWTEATWNLMVGCSAKSRGCAFCYAMSMAMRIANAAQAILRAGGTLTPVLAAYRRIVMWDRGGMDAADLQDKALPRWNGRVEFVETLLSTPQRWKRPRRIFVNSMSDLFHEKVSLEVIQTVFAGVAQAPWHQYQILTKRSDRLLGFNEELPWKPYIWMGVSVENVDHIERIDDLRATDAAVKFLSLEPLLEPLGNLNLNGIDWVIAGGESGWHARPMECGWVRDIRDQCLDAGVPFFFKQWGGTNKKEAGRVMDGRTWDQMPTYVMAGT